MDPNGINILYKKIQYAPQCPKHVWSLQVLKPESKLWNIRMNFWRDDHSSDVEQSELRATPQKVSAIHIATTNQHHAG